MFNTTYSLPSLSGATVSKSYRGKVPDQVGDTTFLELAIPCDFSTYTHVYLRFEHICKVSPSDITKIQYRRGALYPWVTIEDTAYTGSGNYESTRGFNAASYPEWRADDSTIRPTNFWWKEEQFEIGVNVQGDDEVSFRFVIIHGDVPYTQASYGWLLENIQITAARHELHPPIVEFVSPLVKDTVYSTGPWEINARVETSPNGCIEVPWLHYTAVIPGSSTVTDSILMTHVSGNAYWKATIPQYIAGTEVSYYVTGKDTTGNEATARSEYVISIPPVKAAVIDYAYYGSYDTLAGPGNTAIVIYSSYVNSWSRHLYLNSELENINPSTSTYINSIAFKTTSLSSSHRTSVRVYMLATNLATNPANYSDPVADGAVLVYQGPMNMVYPDWINLSFTGLPFLLPGGSNLMVYVEDDSPTSGSYAWRGESVIANQTQYGTTRTIGSAGTGARKPVTRFGIGSKDYGDHSVATHSIDIADTIAISPITQVPVVATVKNKGALNLGTAVVSYSVNGSAPVSQTITFNPTLPWDFNHQDTLGRYFPKVNGFDTVVVWVNMPNSINDEITFDDTLIKVVYGRSDILMAFVDPPSGTVYNTGPYEIKANIQTLLGLPITQVSLNIATTYKSATVYDTLSMVFDASDSLWKSTIPQKLFGSDVVYSIDLTDFLGNKVHLKNNYYIKRLQGGAGTGWVYVGDTLSTITNVYNPYYVMYDYGWSRTIALGSEIGHGAGGTISSLAYYPTTYFRSTNMTNQSLYLKAVPENSIISNSYIDPLMDGATLVWQGTIPPPPANAWMDLKFATPFLLPPGSNLLVYWINNDGSWGGNIAWKSDSSSVDMGVYGYADNTFPTGVGTSQMLRPVMRLNIIGGSDLEHSVALAAIDSPDKRSVIVGNATPVQVTIRNKGMSDLNSCHVNWSLNGVKQLATDYVYRNPNGLPEDFTDTITIDSYIPTDGKMDTIWAWVSLPNGQVDSITYDDSLSVTHVNCSSILPGTYLVGAGGTFSSLNEALATMQSCGVGGDVHLQLKGTFVGNVNLSNMSEVMQGYNLTISSYDNHPDSAIIRVNSGVGVTMSKSDNIVLKGITIDATAGTYGIQFTDLCENVVIRDCKILANPTSTSTSTNTAGIYCSGSTGGTVKLKSVSFINNEISGGHYNIYLYYIFGRTANMGTTFTDGLVIDSNTMTGAYGYGLFSYYHNVYKSISNNTITSRSTSSIYYGMYMYYYNNIDKLIGNKVTVTSTSAAYGIYLYYYVNSAGVTTQALVANNEIRIFGTSNTMCGLRLYGNCNRIDAYNNSIYATGTTGTIYGLEKYPSTTGYQTNVEGNSVYVSTGGTGYPFYSSSATYITPNYGTTNYNNYYSTGAYVGYAGSAMTTLAALQTASTQDSNSVNVLPEFIDVNTDLNLVHDVGLLCPRQASVPEDILGVSRFGTTSMGCYGITPLNGNGMLKEITGLTDGASAGQTENASVVVCNVGSTTLTDINLGWSVNGVSRGNANYTVNLQRGDFATITLGSITYPTNNVSIKVWINNLNNGNLADERIEDDTINSFINVCQGAYSGVLTVGQGGTFPDMESLYKALDLCGISGDVTAALMPGVYSNINLSDNSTLFGNHKLTITSSTGNVNSVRIRPSSGVAVRLDNTNNVEIRGITIDATAGTAGIQFMSACTNIVIRDNKILTSDTATAAAFSGIYKASGTGLVDNVQIINNELDGGYAGIYFYVGTGTTALGTNVTIDSNKVTNTYYYGIYTYYLNAKSVSYNTITNDNVKPSNTTFHGLHLYYARNGGNVIGNRIHVSDTNIKTTLNGLYTYYIDTAIVANNEVILNSNATTTNGLYIDYPRAVDYVFNSVLVNGTKTTVRALYWYTYTNSNYDATLKNNILVANGGTTTQALHLTANVGSYQNNYRLGYNNYYSTGTSLGFVGGTRANLAAWQSVMTADTHSVNILPQFVNPANSLELTTASFANDTLLGTPVAGVLTDIRSHFRSLATPNMGAYERPPSGLDGMAWEAHLSEYIAVDKQNISVSLDVLNPSAVALTDATFGWSVNGNVISTTVPYTFTPSLTTYERRNGVPVGNFNASGNIGDVIEVKVWIQSINSMTDTVHKNDTVSKTFTIIPLAEFADPLVKDTIGSLAFDVYATIYEGSGALVTAPAIYIETTIEGSCRLHDYDTIPMVFQNGKWVANIPKQYYNSKVIYSLHVSDNVGNNIVLKDTVFIEFDSAPIAPIVDFLYTGDVQTITLPRGVYELECWGANGGNRTTLANGGTGGYSKGTYVVSKKTTVYIGVGGFGGTSNISVGDTVLGSSGWNGGGARHAYSGGGGASHIAIANNRGELKQYVNNQSEVLIVAGGGGSVGSADYGGGVGGGLTGGNSTAGWGTGGNGGTQTAGGASTTYPLTSGSFGQGGQGFYADNGYGGAGGGGWYGGGGTYPDDSRDDDKGGGGGSGYIGGVTNGITAEISEVGFIANPDVTGNGYVRITTISGGAADVYTGNNLAIFKLLSPLFNNDSICPPDYLPVQVSLYNSGENDYDFATDSITLGYEIINPRGGIYSGSVVINTDSLISKEFMEVELMSAMPVLGGTYSIKAWVTSAIDNFICDDTLKTTYTSSKLALPIVENFSTGIPKEIFDTKPTSGTSAWEWYSGSATIQPDSGTGMIRFNGSSGSAAVLNTLQLDLYQVSNPFVEFWYYHDTNRLDDYSSYLLVNVKVNDASTTMLGKIYLQDPGGKHGWTYYRYSLNNYTANNDCIMIQFEAMNNYSDLTQYIDYIRISSDPDAAVSKIIVTPPPVLCSQGSSDVLVVIATGDQSISLGNESLILDVNGTKHSVSLQGKTLRSNSSDTILVLSKTAIPFEHISMKAYFSTPIDNLAINDTAKLNISMDPKFTIDIQKLSQTGSPAFAEIEHKQIITIENTGNIDLPAIGLLMKVNSSASDKFPYSFTTRDTLSTNLAVGEIKDYTFTNAYIVPWAKYTVEVYAYLLCDSAAANVMEYVEEDVDVTDLSIVTITEPSISTTSDHVGDSLSVSIDIRNRNFARSYNNEVNVVISITDLSGLEKHKIQEEVPFIAAGSTMSYDFKEKYAVPKLDKYILKVYIKNTDSYMLNNIISMGRVTDLELGVLDKKGTSFIVKQNVPNPTQGKTVINYIIPQDGEVVFTLYSINGQLLQSRKEEALFGENQIELNLSNYASGIYFYTMEYNGQRITKRMSIKR